MATYQKYADMYKNRVSSKGRLDQETRVTPEDHSFEERTSISPLRKKAGGVDVVSRSSISPGRYANRSAVAKSDLKGHEDKNAYMTFLEI